MYHLPFLTPIFLLCFSVNLLPAQEFYEVFRSDDPEPDGIGYSSGGINGYGKSVSLDLPWAISGTNNSYDQFGNDFKKTAGAAYLYQQDLKGQWSFYKKIVASDRDEGDQFGAEVSISGNNLAVSAPLEDEDQNGENRMSKAGSLYVFALDSNGLWQETQKLIPSDRAVGDHFGNALDIEHHTILVGSQLKQWDAGNGNVSNYVGAAYVFEQDSMGSWQETQKLLVPNPIGGERFGRSVGLSGDWAAVGAPREDEDANGTLLHDAGAVYLYQRDSSGQWVQQQVLTPSDRNAYEWFGSALDLQDSLLIVGAIWEETDSLGQHPIVGAGSAYIFRLQPTGIWQEEQKLSGYTRASFAHFGRSVAIEGGLATIGYENNPQNNMEEVSVFEYQGSRWILRQALTDWATPLEIGFGRAMDLDESVLITNSKAKRVYPLGDELGRIYIFENCLQPEIAWSDTICPGSSYPFGNQWLDQGGYYVDTLSGFRGCDSIIRLDLAVLSPQSTVYEDAGSLSITAPGASVQWLDCLNGYAPVPAATDLQFFPQQTGSYAAAVSQYGCSDTSECVAFVIADITPDWGTKIQVFPNPTEAILQIKGEIRLEQVRLYSLPGQLVKEIQSVGREAALDLSDLPAGMYLLEIETFQGILQQKVLKQ